MSVTNTALARGSVEPAEHVKFFYKFRRVIDHFDSTFDVAASLDSGKSCPSDHLQTKPKGAVVR